MKTCLRCEEKPTILLPHGEYCKKHFLDIIQKRTRKNLLGTFDFNQTYKILKTPQTKIAINLLNKIYKNRLKLKETTKQETAHIIPTLLEDEAEIFLDSFYTNTDYKRPKKIYPLRVILRQELKEYAKIIKEDFEVKESHLDELDKAHPGTKFATLKTIESFENNQK